MSKKIEAKLKKPEEKSEWKDAKTFTVNRSVNIPERTTQEKLDALSSRLATFIVEQGIVCIDGAIILATAASGKGIAKSEPRDNPVKDGTLYRFILSRFDTGLPPMLSVTVIVPR